MTSVRRIPKQARSRELVDRVLTSAGELFAARGYAETTTNLIAEQAGVSIGSLYQFFADKAEILDALHEKWTARLSAELDQWLRPRADADFTTIVDHVLDIHAALNRQPPGLLGFLLISSAGSESANGVAEAIRVKLVDMLAVSTPALPVERRWVVAAMLVHISNGLYTVGSTAGATDPAVRAEVREALVSYLAAVERA